MKHIVELALGTNLGNKKENLNKAIENIQLEVGEVVLKSKVVETEPYGYISENNFLNMIILVETKLSPVKLLETLKSIEQKMGRELQINKHNSYIDRIIDIDILKYQNIHFTSPPLNIPHLKINERNFFNFSWINEQ